MVRRFGFAIVIALFLCCNSAWAVVDVSGNGNTDAASLAAALAPGPNLPYFDNVGSSSTGHASVVYLGGGWVISAAHNALGNVPWFTPGGASFGGIAYPVDLSTVHHLTNHDYIANSLSQNSDIVVFHLTSSPSLPSMISAISNSTPSGQQIMIGNGASIVSPLSWNGHAGFNTDGGHTIRWGENNVDQANLITQDSGGIDTYGFGTMFDQSPYTTGAALPNEAQATPGDSGGGVFGLVGGQWVLSGIIIGVSGGLSGQPQPSVLFGDETYIADLSQYQDQIMAIVPEPASGVLALFAAAGVALFYRRRAG